MSADILERVQKMTVTMADGSTGEYVLQEERADGSLVIRRPTYLEQLLVEDDSQPLTDVEFESLVLPHLAPGDDEG